jgi:hypothetical protein
MLTKSREILHPSGFKFKTPLLIPSFSSKGFSINKKDIGGKKIRVSDLYDVMLVCKELLHESLLVSAYDLHYQLIPKPHDFHCTEIVFIDSGGYETSNSYDFSGVNETNHEINDWTETDLANTLNNWPEEYPAIIVNFDHGKVRLPFSEQVANAKAFFENYGENKLTNFLIKPETKEQSSIPIESILKQLKLVKGFNIIGVTEKEIGNSILNRMVNISKLRLALDKVNPAIPIHVFGSLDPITTTLYYMAGAEIFDGLTWLKFSYHDSLAIYTHNYAVMNDEIGIHVDDKGLKIKSLTGNINYLNKFKFVLMDFNATREYSVFKEIGGKNYPNILENAYKRYSTNLTK